MVNNIVYHIGDTGIAIRGTEVAKCAPLVRGDFCESNKEAGIGVELASSKILRNQINLNEKAGIGIS